MKFLYASILFLFTFQSTAQLSGGYTVGGTTPDFNTIGEATSALNSQGVNGPVWINIRDGVYSGDSIYLNGLTGVSAINSITFQSESLDSSAVTIENAAKSVILLGDSTCQFINIKHLKLVESGPHPVMEMVTGSAHIDVYACSFVQQNTLKPCIEFGSYLNSGVPISSHFTIRSNKFHSSADNNDVIYLRQNAEAIDSIVIDSNLVEVIGISSSPSNAAFEIENSSNVIVTNNKISGDLGYGVYLYRGWGTALISSNEIYTYQDGAWAIEIEDGAFDASISNNILYSGNGASNMSTSGIDLYDVNGSVDVFNNTIKSDRVGLYAHGDTELRIKNNIFHIGQPLVTSQFSGIYHFSQLATPPVIDFNTYYSDGLFAIYLNGPTADEYVDLPSHLATGNDSNSFLLFDPLFYDDSTNLRACSDSLIGTGDPSVLLAYDIDGETRSALLPSIGADYFEPLSVDFSSAITGYDVQFTNLSNWANDFVWDFGDGNSSTDEHPQHTYASAGSYTVYLTASNNCETLDTNYTIGITVGMDELKTNNLIIYPNPSSGKIHVKATTHIENIAVLDQFGRTVASEKPATDGSCDFTELRPGIYHLIVDFGTNKVATRLVLGE